MARRGNCPECGYSAAPNELIGQERKHFWPHSLECTRCGYRTETKQTWDETDAAWNAKRHPKHWYPIECEHGYDCCPICDGARRDTITLRTNEQNARPTGETK